MKNWRRRAVIATRCAMIVGGCIALLLWSCNATVESAAEDKIFDKPVHCPTAPTALLLGVSKYVGQNENLFYWPRVRAAAALYESGRVRGIVISGDNGTLDYNEPDTMKADLVALGVPEHHLTCDYAGFRTLDSVIRMSKVFGQSEFIVVSQRFHCERAIFLAESLGLKAWGLAADDVKGKYGKKVARREILARAMAVFDIWAGTQPKFLGNREYVGLRQP